MQDTTIKVVNIKCGGCDQRIKDALNKLGLSDVEVSVEKQEISFKGDKVEEAKNKLAKMGYPEAGTPAAESIIKKGKSYVSCAVGRWGPGHSGAE
ncbi:MAG: heavy-metal-associated domain-containing protein [Candidatus Saccharimonadales bacterium]|nr:heavy-metal-associated domain-containing protein [Candidatus Saccharimonadales bacterium]